MKINEQSRLVLLGIVAFLLISGCMQKTGDNFSGETAQRHNPDLQESPIDTSMPMNTSMNGTLITKETSIKNDYQEVDLQIKADGYSPDVIIAKKGIPLKINLTSDNDAGCAIDIVFPEFNINRTVPAGSSEVIEIMPEREGTYNYRCSMDMYRGKLIITK